MMSIKQIVMGVAIALSFAQISYAEQPTNDSCNPMWSLQSFNRGLDYDYRARFDVDRVDPPTINLNSIEGVMTMPSTETVVIVVGYKIELVYMKTHAMRQAFFSKLNELRICNGGSK
jgi:hypothetical protein